MAIESGKTRRVAATEVATRTTIADSVAYATDENGSDAKIGSANVFRNRVSSIASDGIGEPTIARFIASRPFAGGTTRVGSWSVWVTWMSP